MRCAQAGELTDAERGTRERLRLRAVERFEGGQSSGEIAAALRVSERSVERWRRALREQGADGVLSKGWPGRPRLSEAQIIRLERELACGPLAHGWADQQHHPAARASRLRAWGGASAIAIISRPDPHGARRTGAVPCRHVYLDR
ncbi:helix-turn-helix domain-containing protein [Streptomyces fagopyri]|uniref:helix-turn-helix domain-containing protein n=1 Tax=Streptomyces fagopyri TaxID=2662397 RepID=UPI0036CC7398